MSYLCCWKNLSESEFHTGNVQNVVLEHIEHENGAVRPYLWPNAFICNHRILTVGNSSTIGTLRAAVNDSKSI